MEKLARGLMWIDDIVLKLNLFVCSCLLLEAVIVAGLGVIFRFVLHDSLSWSDEVSAYLFVWVTCLGAAAGVKLRAHPEVRVLADRVPAVIAPLLKDFTDCAILALGAVFVLYGTDMLELMGTETATSVPISMVYPYLSIPLCGALLAFHSLVRIVVSHLAPQAQSDATLVEGVSDHLQISRINIMWAIAFGAGLLGLGVPVAICIGIAATIAVALQSAAGSLGLLSPVSMSMLVYACTANVSVGTMFIAGIIPMLLVVASFMIVNYVTAVRNDYSAVAPFDLARLALVERPESTA